MLLESKRGRRAFQRRGLSGITPRLFVPERVPGEEGSSRALVSAAPGGSQFEEGRQKRGAAGIQQDTRQQSANRTVA